jgi:hypothetical protein
MVRNRYTCLSDAEAIWEGNGGEVTDGEIDGRFDNKVTCTNEVIDGAEWSFEDYCGESEFFRRRWQEKFDR